MGTLESGAKMQHSERSGEDQLNKLKNASRELASVIRGLAAESDVKNKLVVAKSGAKLLKRPGILSGTNCCSALRRWAILAALKA
jgi:hypothetical protein